MTNLERLRIDLREYQDVSDEELEVHLMENNLTWNDEYDPKSNSNKKEIYQTAVSFLESIANSPSLMKNYKTDDVTISMFHKNLLNQIDYLNRKIRMMPNDDDLGSDGGATIGYLFTK